jgi:hypothetical protein
MRTAPTPHLPILCVCACGDEEKGTDPKDTVNETLEKRMAACKLLGNASFSHRTEMNPTLVIIALIFGAVALVSVIAMLLN